MHTTRSHIDMFNTHLSIYGIDGLLPQNLSPTLLHLMSKEFNNFREESSSQDKHPFAILFLAVQILIKGEIIQLNDHESLKMPLDEVFNKINCYGVSIVLEELRRWRIIGIAEKNLPTVDNIFDENSDLTVTGDYKAIQDLLDR